MPRHRRRRRSRTSQARGTCRGGTGGSRRRRRWRGSRRANARIEAVLPSCTAAVRVTTCGSAATSSSSASEERGAEPLAAEVGGDCDADLARAVTHVDAHDADRFAVHRPDAQAHAGIVDHGREPTGVLGPADRPLRAAVPDGIGVVAAGEEERAVLAARRARAARRRRDRRRAARCRRHASRHENLVVVRAAVHPFALRTSAGRRRCRRSIPPGPAGGRCACWPARTARAAGKGTASRARARPRRWPRRARRAARPRS